MSSIKTLNGIQYTLPGYNDTGWGANTGNVLTQYLQAIADVTLQLSGGAFTLTAETDFGANFGLKALYLKSETANPASAGVVRLAKTDSVKWRNNANGADIALAIDGSDNLQYNATKVLLSGAVVNADINASAAIAYSKLALAGSIVNADIASGAAIAYSKLTLTGAILNADLAGSIAYSKLTLTGSVVNGDLVAGTLTNTAINASAAIALSKLAALGTAKALQSNASTGAIEVSAVTNTELGYVSGVTSAIQTQINAISTHVFQIVSATSSGSPTSTSATYADITGLAATITPSSTSHKILVIANINARITNAASSFCSLDVRLVRGVTTVDTRQNFSDSNVPSDFVTSTGCYIFLDSPSSVSSLTYKFQFANQTANGTVAINPATSTASTITLIEVA